MGTFIITFTNPHIASLSLSQKILLNSVMFYTGTVFYLIPTFMKKQLISADYHNSSKFKKAQTDLFMIKVFSPFWAYALIGSYIVLGMDLKLMLLTIIILYYFVSATYTVKKGEKLYK